MPGNTHLTIGVKAILNIQYSSLLVVLTSDQTELATRNKVFNNNIHPTSPLWESIMLLSSCPSPQMAKAILIRFLPSLYLRETQELHSVTLRQTSFKNTVSSISWKKPQAGKKVLTKKKNAYKHPIRPNPEFHDSAQVLGIYFVKSIMQDKFKLYFIELLNRAF